MEQEELKDCGIACFAMILEYYGGYMSLEDIQELFHADKNGTTAYDMVEGMKKVGFEAKGFQCPLENLLKGDVLFPCIAHVTLNQSYSHFVVIYDVDENKQELVVADPANKITKIPSHIFHKIYSGNVLTCYPITTVIHNTKQNISIKNIFQFLQNSKPLVWQIFFLSILILIYSIGSSFLGEVMLKGLNANQSESYFFYLTFFFGSMIFLKWTSQFFRNKLFLWVEKKVDVLLSMDVFHNVLSLSYSYYHNHTTGDILARMDALDQVKDTLCKWMMVLMIDVPLMLVCFWILFLMNPSISILILLFFLIQLLLLRLFSSPLEEEIEEYQQSQSQMSTLEVECIRSFETIKGISLESYFYQKLMRQKVSFLKHREHLELLIFLENYGKKLCEEFSSLLLLLVGCLFVRKGTLTFGTLLTIQNLAMYFYAPMNEFIDLDKDTKQAKKALERVSVFYQKQVEKGYLKKKKEGAITFHNLCYSYRPDIEILHHIHLTINMGEKVLVLGTSGSGKSTLFKLLKRYYPVPRGSIQIGKNDLLDYEDTDDICYIHQTENLYTGSLLENLTLKEHFKEDDMKEIVQICEVEEIIQHDRLGYYRLIEENGVNLSGGERQRIILARTLLRPFEILIIDEGLNQVDVNLERRILKKVFQKFWRQTIIVISHREENLDLFTRKIRINQGMIRENVVRTGGN